MSQGRECEAGPGARRMVLHVLPNDLPRGAQVAAKELRKALEQRSPDRHEIMTIFEGEEAGLDADHRLHSKSGRLRRLGFDPLALLRFHFALARRHPTVVVAHGGEPLKYLGIGPKRAKIIYLAIGTVTESARRGPRRRLYQWLMSRADKVIAISPETLNESAQLFRVGPMRLSVVPNFRDPSVYCPADKRPNAQMPVRLIFVGHLAASKRPTVFVQLVSELLRRGLNVQGWVVGDGPLRAEVEYLAAQSNVRMLGTRSDVPDLLRESDIFVFTSVPEGEGMPGVLIEAGLTGLAVISTECPGVSSIVEDGQTGYIVGVDDFDRLVSAAVELVMDKHRRTEMGVAARERCVKHFSVDSITSTWLRILDGVSSGCHPQRRDANEEALES